MTKICTHTDVQLLIEGAFGFINGDIVDNTKEFAQCQNPACMQMFVCADDSELVPYDLPSGVSMPKRLAVEKEPPPKGYGPEIWPLVMKDIEERVEMGLAKYGTALRANNGRDPLIDAYQEALDLVMYMRQAIHERDNDIPPMLKYFIP